MPVGSAFSSLRVHNYRTYFVGQVVSMCGTWAQNIAMGWLVLDLSDDSGVALGVVTACEFLPMLLFGLWAGLLADRFDKRRLIVGTQIALALAAAGLAVVDLAHVVELWMVFALAFLFGMATAVDMPARLSFVIEMVGRGDLPNALALNSAVVNAGRIIGPAIAGVLITTGGTGLCFAVNALSYVGTILAVLLMRRDELLPADPVPRGRGQVRAGLRYVQATPVLRANIVMMAVIGLLTFNFPVVLPLLAKVTFDGDAGTYSLMASGMGVGAFVSALVLAAMGRTTGRRLVAACVALGVSVCLGAAAPSLALLVCTMPFIGLGQVVAGSSSNALVQLDTEPAMRGRVTAIRSLTGGGLTPIGGVLAGTVAELAGPRIAMAVGGVGALVAVLAFGRPLLRPDHQPPEPSAYHGPDTAAAGPLAAPAARSAAES